jgi:hypothetical protein
MNSSITSDDGMELALVPDWRGYEVSGAIPAMWEILT